MTKFCKEHQLELTHHQNKLLLRESWICPSCKIEPIDIQEKKIEVNLDSQVNNENPKIPNTSENKKVEGKLKGTQCPKHPNVEIQYHMNYSFKTKQLQCTDCKKRIGPKLPLGNSIKKSNIDIEYSSQGSFSKMSKPAKIDLKRKRVMFKKSKTDKADKDKLENLKKILHEFDKEINIEHYDPSIFANIRVGATRAKLNISKETNVWVSETKSKQCIRNNCIGTIKIAIKDIIGKTNGAKYAVTHHRVCHNDLKCKKLFLETFTI